MQLWKGYGMAVAIYDFETVDSGRSEGIRRFKFR